MGTINGCLYILSIFLDISFLVTNVIFDASVSWLASNFVTVDFPQPGIPNSSTDDSIIVSVFIDI